MKHAAHTFRATDVVNLRTLPTRIRPYYRSGKHYRSQLAALSATLSDQQKRLRAGARHALLLIFQGMDASGKDGLIAHVMAGVDPQGCSVASFKAPSAEELRHDFLWRTVQALPAFGQIGVFNRSYYEEVLIARVHPELVQAEPHAAGRDVWQDRYRSIVEHEQHLARNRTVILKFFLHLSRAEQRERFLARIADPHKQWKACAADVAERGRWDEYQRAYEQALRATHHAHAPWYLIPADDKKNARLIVAHIIVETLRDLHLTYPRASAAQLRALGAMRRQLRDGD